VYAIGLLIVLDKGIALNALIILIVHLLVVEAALRTRNVLVLTLIVDCVRMAHVLLLTFVELVALTMMAVGELVIGVPTMFVLLMQNATIPVRWIQIVTRPMMVVGPVLPPNVLICQRRLLVPLLCQRRSKKRVPNK